MDDLFPYELENGGLMTAISEVQQGPSGASAEKPPIVEMVDQFLTAAALWT
jgi:hypothetical protein